MFPSHMVHEHMVDHRAHCGAEAGQVMDRTDPGAVHLHPGDTKGQEHQEEEKRDAWREGKWKGKEDEISQVKHFLLEKACN